LTRGGGMKKSKNGEKEAVAGFSRGPRREMDKGISMKKKRSHH